jgi:cysteinyl-tRNA synthetase
MIKQLHKASDDKKPRLKSRILAAGELLGILQQDPLQWLQGDDSQAGISAREIEDMIAQRQVAKLAKDYGLADDIRQQLLGQGVVLEDSREGTQWKRKAD